jgi:hypothetical protein
MSASTPTKQAVAPAAGKPVVAFGIEVAPTKSGSSAVAVDEEAVQKKKRIILAGSLIVLSGLVLWWQYRPTPADDPDAAAHPQVREVTQLQQKGDAAGLAQLAKSPDVVVARRAVTSLASMGNFDMIRASLNDRRMDVRYAAVSGLGQAGDVRHLETLSKYTEDPAPEVRIAAMRGISNIRDFSIFDHLIPMLSDPESSVRRSAIQAIQDRVGLQFPDYKPDDSAESRARAIGRIRAMIPKMKQVFDRANEFELRRQQH